MSGQQSILVADDDSNDAFLLQRAFSMAHINSHLAFVGDGEEAIRYLRNLNDRQQPPPCLLLLDLKMPRINGFEVLEWVRRQPGLKRLPITVLTSSDSPQDINRAYDLGANSYLVKPFSNQMLIQVVKSIHDYWMNLNRCPEETAASLQTI